MMFLFQLWKEGLGILHPNQLRIFTLVLLKNIRDMYIVFFRLCGFALGGMLTAGIIVSYMGYNVDVLLMTFMLIIAALMMIVVRPSIQRKSYAYISSYALPIVVT